MPFEPTEQCNPFGQTRPRQGACGIARARTAELPAATAKPEGGVAGLPNRPVAPTIAISPGSSVMLKAGAEIVNVGGKPGVSTPFQTDWKLPVNENVNRQLSSGTPALLVTRNSPWKPPPCQVLVVAKVTLISGTEVCVTADEMSGDTLPAASRASTKKM